MQGFIIYLSRDIKAIDPKLCRSVALSMWSNLTKFQRVCFCWMQKRRFKKHFPRYEVGENEVHTDLPHMTAMFDASLERL